MCVYGHCKDMLHGAGLTTRLRIATASKQTLSNKAKPITIFTNQCMHTHTHTHSRNYKVKNNPAQKRKSVLNV